jgi:hypothetical protein
VYAPLAESRSADGLECPETDVSDAVDIAIGAIADRQRGVITYAQLIAAGLDRHAIARRVRCGLLRPVFRGVYLVGHGVPARHAIETAALLCCAPDSLLSHATSLAMWGLYESVTGAPIDVTVIGRNCAAHSGINLHRTRTLQRLDISRRFGLSVTSPVRALLESASIVATRDLERAVDEALALKLVTRPGLLAVIERYPGQRGCVVLRELADPGRGSQITKQEAEERFRVLLHKAGAPPSESNVWIGHYKVDRVWRAQRVIAEIDSMQFHRDIDRFEIDHRREQDLKLMGYEVVRFTRRQVMFEPEYVMFRLGLAFSPALVRDAA